VPATVAVPEGSTSATFTITTSPVASSAAVRLEATYAGTLVADLVAATSSGAGATLRVYATATNTLIGTLAAGSGQFTVANPQNVTVRSSLGGSATRSVTLT
jgi:hypothetical protein